MSQNLAVMLRAIILASSLTKTRYQIIRTFFPLQIHHLVGSAHALYNQDCFSVIWQLWLVLRHCLGIMAPGNSLFVLLSLCLVTLFSRPPRDFLGIYRCLPFVISTLFGNGPSQSFCLWANFKFSVSKDFLNTCCRITFGVGMFPISHCCAIANVCNMTVNQTWSLVNQNDLQRVR